MAKLSLKFAGMEDYIETLVKMGENAHAVVDDTLKQGVDIINEELHTEMRSHRITGETERSIRDSEKVRWTGDKASVKYGFNIKKGGEPAIYLERGGPYQNPTPVLKPAEKRAESRLKDLMERSMKLITGETNE